MERLNLERSFGCNEELDEEQTPMAITVLMDQVKTKGLKELYLA